MWLPISVFLFLVTVSSAQTTTEKVYDELFRFVDTDNDTRLTSSECRQLWLRFDGDGDHILGKLEFMLKWTFLDLDSPHYAPFFYKQLDNNFDGQIIGKEITAMCNFFDDDDDGHITRIEFDMNWVALFTFPKVI